MLNKSLSNEKIPNTPHRLLPPATPRVGMTPGMNSVGYGATPLLNASTEEIEQTLFDERLELTTFAVIYSFDKLDIEKNQKILEISDRIPSHSKIGPERYEGMNILRDGKYKYKDMPEDEEDDIEDDDIEDDDDDDNNESNSEKRKRKEKIPDKKDLKKRRVSSDEEDEEEKDENNNIAIRKSSSSFSDNETCSPTDKEFLNKYRGTLETEDSSKVKEYDADTYDQVIQCGIENAKKCLPLDMVLGLEDCKRLLINNITKPLLKPDVFIGTTPAQKFLCMWGKEGSGISTVVRAFCKAMKLRLYAVNSHISKEGMMKTVLNCSLDQPTVILLDHCWEFISNGPKGSIGAELNYYYEQFELKKKPVWFIFSLEQPPQHIQPRFYNAICKHIAWANPPNAQARERLLYRFIYHQFRSYKQNTIAKDKQKDLLVYLVRASYLRTPREIFNFVKDVFRKKMESCPLHVFKDIGTNYESILPDYTDFSECLYGTADNPCISTGNAELDQSLYYDNQQVIQRSNDPRYSKELQKQQENKSGYSARFDAQQKANHQNPGKRNIINPFSASNSLAKKDKPGSSPLRVVQSNSNAPKPTTLNNPIRMSEIKKQLSVAVN